MARRKGKNPFVSFLIGGVIGSSAALIMAPASGRETRNNISSSVNTIMRKAGKQKNILIRDARRTAHDIIRKGEDAYRVALRYAEGKYNASAQNIETEIRSIKNAVNAAVDSYQHRRKTQIQENPLENEVIVNEMLTDFEDETLPKNEGMGRRQI